MLEGEELLEARRVDRFERGLRLLSRTWIALILLSWFSVGWISGGRHHLVQPLVIVLSPLVLVGLVQMHRGTRGRPHDLLSVTLLVAVGLVIVDPVLGYLRGTIASAGLAFVGLPFFCLALWAWNVDGGLAPAASRAWARAAIWSAVLALAIIGVWSALIFRGLTRHHWSQVDVRGTGPTLLFLGTVAVLLPGSLVTTWIATHGARRDLATRPHHVLD